MTRCSQASLRPTGKSWSTFEKRATVFYAWGAVPGLRNTPTWETMERGDYVLCVYDSTYHYVARVLDKYENERFARRVWGEDEDGRTWKYVYFLTEPIAVNQPLYEFEGYLHSRYQGFTRISNERLNEIEEDFGAIEGFIQEILEYQGEELPDELLLAPDRSEEMAMATYLLIWNPNRWTWEEDDVRRDIAQLEESGRVESFRWSVGTYRQIEAGGRLFLIRLGSEPRGIFLSGFARGYAYRATHWDPSERKRVFPESHAREAVAHLREGSLAFIPGCGHMPHVECPDRFLATLDGFLLKRVHR
jgi:hypothetical protein